jgi:DNA-directed RNA polymerase specialized sigma24 family protein
VTTDTEFQAWINDLAQGRETAVQVLWEGYFDKLVQLARRKLNGVPRRVVDEEDIALSALKSFVRGVERGRFPKLDDHHDLWRVLVVITARKAIALQKRHYTQKRGAGRVHGESALGGPPDASALGGINQVLGHEPTAEFQALMTERLEQMLGELDEPRLRVVALCKLEGYSNEEIAGTFTTTTRTVERWLGRIRKAWEASDELRRS